MKKWYVVYTEPNQERKVTAIIKQKDINCFIPVNTVLSAKKSAREPLFPFYVFVCATEPELRWILKLRWVINMLFFLSEPVTLTEDEIHLLRSFVTTHKNIKIANTGFGCYKKNVSQLLKEHKVVAKETYLTDARKESILVSSLGVTLIAEKEDPTVIVLEEQVDSYRFLARLAARLHLIG
jgi:transcription antitermination factor NusG